MDETLLYTKSCDGHSKHFLKKKEHAKIIIFFVCLCAERILPNITILWFWILKQLKYINPEVR